MDRYRIKTIVNDVFKKVLNEAQTFKPGESIVIGGSEALGRKIIRAKYGLNPDDFEYVGSGKFIYKAKGRSGAARQPKPKKEKEFLGRKEGETEQDYLERVRELNKKFADVEKEIEGEQWRPVVNTGRYRSGNTDYTRSHEVSNMGRLRTLDYEDPMRSRISTGYDAPTRKARQFHLDAKTADGEWEKTTPPVHTMVADAWLDAPEGNIEDYDVEHIDGNYHNNRADNLRYVLRKGRRGRKANAEIPTETPLAESVRRMIKESVKRALNEMDLTNNQIRNITGITDDDELNTACMEEDADNLASNIVKDLRDEYGFYNIYDKNVVLDFNVVKDLLEQKYGMKDLGFDENSESHSFANDNFIVELWSKEGYPRLAQFHLQNMYVNYR